MISPEVLRRYPYFSPIHEATLKRVAMISQDRCYEAGACIFAERDPSTHVLLIVQGEVELLYTLPSGREQTIGMIPAGEMLGWTAIVPPHRRIARAVATRATEVVAIDAEALRQLVEEDPVLGHRLMEQVCKTLSNRLDATRVQLAFA